MPVRMTKKKDQEGRLLKVGGKVKENTPRQSSPVSQSTFKKKTAARKAYKLLKFRPPKRAHKYYSQQARAQSAGRPSTSLGFIESVQDQDSASANQSIQDNHQLPPQDDSIPMNSSARYQDLAMLENERELSQFAFESSKKSQDGCVSVSLDIDGAIEEQFQAVQSEFGGDYSDKGQD